MKLKDNSLITGSQEEAGSSCGVRVPDHLKLLKDVLHFGFLSAQCLANSKSLVNVSYQSSQNHQELKRKAVF